MEKLKKKQENQIKYGTFFKKHLNNAKRTIDKTKTLGSLEKKTKEKQRNTRKTKEKKSKQRIKGSSTHKFKPVEHIQFGF